MTLIEWATVAVACLAALSNLWWIHRRVGRLEAIGRRRSEALRQACARFEPPKAGPR
jgi:hypothetical protein